MPVAGTAGMGRGARALPLLPSRCRYDGRKGGRMMAANAKRWDVAMLAGLAMATFLLGAGSASRAGETGADAAPDFALKAFDGRNHRLSELRGQVVLINFWTSRCGPCRAQMSELAELHAELSGAGVGVLSVNFDSDPERAREFITTHGIAFPVLRDDGREVSRRYGVRGIPRLVMIDRDGLIRHVYNDHRTGQTREYRALVLDLLEE